MVKRKGMASRRRKGRNKVRSSTRSKTGARRTRGAKRPKSIFARRQMIARGVD